MKRNIIIASLLLASAGTAYGIVMVVTDPALTKLVAVQHISSEKIRAAQFVRQITEAVNQIKAIQALTKDFGDYRNYLAIVNGKWAQKVPGMAKLASMLNKNSPGDLRNLGWDLTVFDRARHLKTKGQALRELRSILDAEANKREFAQVRESIMEVYGEVPVSAEGVAIEAAYREIATVSAKVGESTKQIELKRERIIDMREEIESGTLAPGDIERMQSVLATEAAELSILQTDAINNATRAQVQSLGLAAGDKSERVRGAIQDRETRMEMSRSLQFGLGVERDERVE